MLMTYCTYIIYILYIIGSARRIRVFMYIAEYYMQFIYLFLVKTPKQINVRHTIYQN